MKNYKKAQAVLLSTTEETELFSVNNQLFKYHKPQQGDGVGIINQHLYITSDDEIKEGDWVIWNNQIEQAKRVESQMAYHGFKKIIATTDTTLTVMLPHDVLIGSQLPQPSQQFIEEYINSYNEGEVITGILVECERIPWNLDTNGSLKQEEELRLKINPDNTITIKESKESWNREEVINLMWEAYKHSNSIFEEEGLRREFDEWIEKNL